MWGEEEPARQEREATFRPRPSNRSRDTSAEAKAADLELLARVATAVCSQLETEPWGAYCQSYISNG